jgi:hypothetical protein
MPIWGLLIIICCAGAVGGSVNALISDNGFIKPRTESIDGRKIVRPGFLGNIFIGAISAGVSWGLYGSLANEILVTLIEKSERGITLSALAGAVLVGIGGARSLTNEVDKTLLTAAASRATASQADPVAAQKIASASPAQVLNIVKSLPTN